MLIVTAGGKTECCRRLEWGEALKNQGNEESFGKEVHGILTRSLLLECPEGVLWWEWADFSGQEEARTSVS